MTTVHLFDGNNVMLRDLDSATHQRIGLRRRWELANTPGELHIWVWDGARHNQRRKDIYPLYKANREPTPEERYAQIGVFREALTHSNAWQVECRGWEGDDVIASLVRKLRGSVITVHSNDADYVQLTGVILNGVRQLPCPSDSVALFKAMVGDSSDNIKGIPGFGPKSWALLETYWPTIERAVDARDLNTLRQIPFSKRHRDWIVDNIDVLIAMLSITRFIPVPDEELNAGIKQGVYDFAKMDVLLRRFFL